MSDVVLQNEQLNSEHFTMKDSALNIVFLWISGTKWSLWRHETWDVTQTCVLVYYLFYPKSFVLFDNKVFIIQT